MLKFATGLLSALAIAVPSVASPVTGTMEDHQVLWQALNENGVTTYLNHEACDTYDAAGFYISSYNVLVVCQDNRITDDVEVQWTENDLDTLRHEAHHVIQDCKLGTQGDDELGSVFTTEEDWKNFVLNSGYTVEQLNLIAQGYIDRGADTDVVIIELEAFAVANSVNARDIAQGVANHCGK